jgi:hypothetical protein
MYKSASRSSQQTSGKRRCRNVLMESSGPAGPTVSIVTGEVFDQRRIEWPVYVTAGLHTDGTLRMLTFKGRTEADAAGYEWVGRQ